MQQTNDTTSTIKLIDSSGAVLGWLHLPADSRLADLDALRALGVARAELVNTRRPAAEVALNRIDSRLSEIGRGLGRMAVRAGKALDSVTMNVGASLTRH